MRGASFISEQGVGHIASEDLEDEQLPTARLFEPSNPTPVHRVNTSQLHQSRLGLLSQAFMLFIVIGFLFSETLSEFWKTK